MAEPISAVLQEVEKTCRLFGDNWALAGEPVTHADPGTSACRCETAVATTPLNVLACALDAGLELVWRNLKRARQAVQATTAAASASRKEDDGGAVQREAAAAAKALSFVATAVTTPGGQDLSAAAAEAQRLLSQLAHTLSRWQQRRALASAEASRQAAASGDLGAVAASAVRAKEHVAMAMWAACLGGPQALEDLHQDLDAANRAADVAVQQLTAAAVSKPGPKAPRRKDVGVGVQPAGREEVQREGAVGAAAAIHVVELQREDATARPQYPAQSAASGGGDTAGVCGSHRCDSRKRPHEQLFATSAPPLQPSTPSAPGESCEAEPVSERVTSTVAAGVPGRWMAGAGETAAATTAPAAPGATQTSSPSSPVATPPLETFGPTAVAAAEGGSSLKAALEAAVATSIDTTSSSPGTGRGQPAVASPSPATAATPPSPAEQDGCAGSASSQCAGSISSGSDRQTGPLGRIGGADAANGCVEPPHSPPDPATADGDARKAAMRRLVLIADQICTDGHLCDQNLFDAAAALSVIMSGSGGAPEQEVAILGQVAAAWADPPTRVAVVQLMSYTARQVRALFASGPLPTTSPGHQALSRVLRWLEVFLVKVISPEATAAQRIESFQLLSRTDIVPCLVGALANMAAVGEAAVRGGGAGSEPAVAELSLRDLLETATDPDGSDYTAWLQWNSGATGPGGKRYQLMMTCVCSMLNNFLARAATIPASPGVQAAHSVMRGALLRSHTLEHTIRTLVLVRHGAKAQGAYCKASELDRCITDVLELLNEVLEVSLWLRPVAVLRDLLLSGPCVQRFLLLHAVSQLCAADGGPDYGLPQHARLSYAAALRGGSGQHRTAQPPTYKLAARVMTASFSWWASHRTRPCSDRALRVVCERAAAAALAAVAADIDVDADACTTSLHGLASRWTSAGIVSLPSDALTFAADDAVPLALASLECAVTLALNGSAGSLRRLWVPVVQAANAAALIKAGGAGTCGQARPLRLLATMPLPSVEIKTAGAGPGPELAPLLAVGYTAALERTIRSAVRPVSDVSAPATATASATDAATVLSMELVRDLGSLSQLLQRGPGLAHLLAHEDLMTSAALISSMVKALKVSFARATEAGGNCQVDGVSYGDVAAAAVAALQSLFAAAAALMPGLGAWPSADDLWQAFGCTGAAGVRHDSAVADSAARPGEGELRGSGRDLSGREQAGGGDGAGDWSKATAGGSCSGSAAGPSTGSAAACSSGSSGKESGPHMAVLTGLFMNRWLPTLLRLVHSFDNGLDVYGAASIADVANVYSSALYFVTLGVQAYLISRGPEVMQQLRPGSANPTRSGEGCGGGGGTGSARSTATTAAAAAADGNAAVKSWKALLLGQLDLPGLLIQAVRLIASVKRDRRSIVDTRLLRPLAVAIQHVLMAFPRLGRCLLRARVAGQLTFLDVLTQANRPAHAGTVDARVRDFLEVAEALSAGKDPSAEELWRTCTREDAGGWAVAALLTPPHGVEADMPKFHLCGSAMCANLAGDSEKGLPLPVVGKGAVRYCSERCKVQHQRDGQEEQARVRAWSREAR